MDNQFQVIGPLDGFMLNFAFKFGGVITGQKDLLLSTRSEVMKYSVRIGLRHTIEDTFNYINLTRNLPYNFTIEITAGSKNSPLVSAGKFRSLSEDEVRQMFENNAPEAIYDAILRADREEHEERVKQYNAERLMEAARQPSSPSPYNPAPYSPTSPPLSEEYLQHRRISESAASSHVYSPSGRN